MPRNLTNRSQPAHTVYGGAHLFSVETVGKLQDLARQFFLNNVPDAASLKELCQIEETALAELVYQRLRDRLAGADVIQDFRIDFEDGYGYRADAEEDKHAAAAGKQAGLASAGGKLPPYSGMRIKPLVDGLEKRALQTLRQFFGAFFEQDKQPKNFAVTLPKISNAQQVVSLINVLSEIEKSHGVKPRTLEVELMIELPQLIVDRSGRNEINEVVEAAAGRCRGAHLGAYDYLSSCGVAACVQRLDHPVLDLVRATMLTALAGTDVWLSDGATPVLPVPIHRGDRLSQVQELENRQAIRNAWRLHYRHIMHGLESAFYQGWDLHPAQVPVRYAALTTFFLSNLNQMSTRLRAFVDKAAQASLVGSTFDDAATGSGLVNFFQRGISFGILRDDDLAGVGMTSDELLALDIYNL